MGDSPHKLSLNDIREPMNLWVIHHAKSTANGFDGRFDDNPSTKTCSSCALISTATPTGPLTTKFVATLFDEHN
jgi:hypothetical protein